MVTYLKNLLSRKNMQSTVLLKDGIIIIVHNDYVRLGSKNYLVRFIGCIVNSTVKK